MESEAPVEETTTETSTEVPIDQPKPTKSKPKTVRAPGEPKAKRGPARPHRRLEDDVINLRIEKLQKRLDRAKGQAEDASRHIEGYKREREFREKGE